jgi:hypothetical protein
MDRDEMSNLYRGPSIDASYQISIHSGTWPPQAILVSDWLISKISSLLKKDNSCLNIDICIQNAIISIQTFKNVRESGFRGEDFLEINQSQTRMACGGHVC